MVSSNCILLHCYEKQKFLQVSETATSLTKISWNLFCSLMLQFFYSSTGLNFLVIYFHHFASSSVSKQYQWYRKTYLSRSPLGLKNLFSLDRCLVYTQTGVWFTQIQITQTFSRWDCKVCLGQAGFQFTQGSVQTGFTVLIYTVYNIEILCNNGTRLQPNYHYAKRHMILRCTVCLIHKYILFFSSSRQENTLY